MCICNSVCVFVHVNVCLYVCCVHMPTMPSMAGRPSGPSEDGCRGGSLKTKDKLSDHDSMTTDGQAQTASSWIASSCHHQTAFHPIVWSKTLMCKKNSLTSESHWVAKVGQHASDDIFFIASIIIIFTTIWRCWQRFQQKRIITTSIILIMRKLKEHVEGSGRRHRDWGHGQHGQPPDGIGG